MINRRAITWLLLCTSLVVLVAAQISFRKPQNWRWAQQEPLTLPVSTEPSERQTDENPPTAKRRAPYPIQKTLDGAADLEPFLTPNPIAVPEMQLSAKADLDANARYHLLQLAKDATTGALEADARSDTRYRALVQKPNDYRGELVKITGDLISLGEPMELQRKLPGLEVCYLGLMAAEQADHQYLVLFTDLPKGLPPRKEWGQLYLRNVTFAGYYYKVAKFTRTQGQVKTWMLPVLVGKTLHIAEKTSEGLDWVNLLTIFGAMAVPVILVALLVPRFFRRADAEHEKLMQTYRERHERKIGEELEGMV
jgi:hypothetical protein